MNCEARHTVPRDTIDALIADVRSEHRSKFKRRRVSGASARARAGQRSKEAEFAVTAAYRIRMLSPREIDEFVAGIERAKSGGAQPIRLDCDR